jgi:hypothetical protein
MRKIFVIALGLAATVSPTLANAQSSAREQTRVIDGTLGALAGAMLAGPIGLLAGAVIGYTVGPEVTGPVLNPPLRRTRSARRHRRKAAAAYAQQQPQQPMYQAYPQQGYAQPAYPQQPVYMAQPQPVAQAYQPLPGQQPMQQGAPMYAPQRPSFNPRQNALVPPPGGIGGGQQYSAVAGGPAPGVPMTPGVPKTPGAAYSPYPQQAPAYGRMPQVQAPPIPMPR